MMEYSVAHQNETNKMIQRVGWPDGRVPWDDPVPPDLESGDERRFAGRIRMCAYCGSMHPADVVAAIKAGARGSWADMKYGWPHKAYFNDVPNPHAGMLESRASANHECEGWIKIGDRSWREPGRPAAATIMWKFYSVHLVDATPEDRAVIETHLGIHFEFTEDGQVSWERANAARTSPLDGEG